MARFLSVALNLVASVESSDDGESLSVLQFRVATESVLDQREKFLGEASEALAELSGIAPSMLFQRASNSGISQRLLAMPLSERRKLVDEAQVSAQFMNHWDALPEDFQVAMIQHSELDGAVGLKARPVFFFKDECWSVQK